jgi:hypothetical protein
MREEWNNLGFQRENSKPQRSCFPEFEKKQSATKPWLSKPLKK